MSELRSVFTGSLENRCDIAVSAGTGRSEERLKKEYCNS